MPRSAKIPLNARGVETSTKVGYTADGKQPGLNLQIREGANGYVRSWVFRYTSPITKKRRELGLGSARAVSLAAARDLAMEAAQKVAVGIDPKEQRDAERLDRLLEGRQGTTFKEAATQCIAAKQFEWRNEKHTAQWSRSLEVYAYPMIGETDVASITMEQVLCILEPIWIEKTETASRVRQRIETVLDWARARKLRSGDNPASLKGGLGELLPKASKVKRVEHFPAMPREMVHTFVQALRSKSGVGALALEFMILTAARTGEVTGAKWDEIDLQSRIWTIPAERMKAGKEHRIPLSERAIQILNRMLSVKQCEYVFTNARGDSHISSGTMYVLMKKRMPEYKEWTPHGFRSTFRDWAAETTSFANETIELAMAHTIANKAEAAYRRGDQLLKRVKLMERWSTFIETEQIGAAVIPLGANRDG